MNREESGQEFLDPEIETEYLAKGTTAEVSELINLPAEVRDRVPDGYVLKEYFTKHPNGESRFLQPPLEIAKSLRNRQETFHDLYRQDLPDLIVKSNFIIGRNANGEETIFELQPKVEAWKDAVYAFGVRANWEELKPEAQARALQELVNFTRRTRALIEDPDKPEIPDLFGSDNLVLTPEGNLRMVDTNISFSQDDDPNLYHECLSRLAQMEELVQELQSIGSPRA